jgi:general secretion pathway protein L
MSTLAVQLPARSRLSARHAAAGESAAGGEGSLLWVLSSEGLSASSHGYAAAGLLPRADSVVAVLDPRDLSWHRVTVPKAPASKLRAALGSVLEEALLEDAEAVHIALEPGLRPGQEGWVAVADRAWLQQQIGALEAAGLEVERVVPGLWPGDIPQGHFHAAGASASSGGSAEEGDVQVVLTLADERGVSSLPLAGTLARQQVRDMPQTPAHWTATPRVSALAERWLEGPVQAVSEADFVLQAVRSLWNLRQFDLVPRKAWTRAWRDAAQRWRTPAWRPVRIGLVALAAAQLVGLNAWAWSQRQALSERRQEQVELVRSAHPRLRTVVDPALQMQRETESLRAAAGRPGPNDLETLLAAAAAAWPPGKPPVQGLRFEPGQLALVVVGWGEAEVRDFRDRLRPAGYLVEAQPGRLVIKPGGGAPGARSPS